jgi:hypothetical protein
MKKILKRYLGEMFKLYHQDDAPGITAYCSVLKDLIYSSFDFFQEKVSKEDIKIEILEIPGELQIHMPRMRIWDGESKVYGYVDVLAPNTTSDEIISYSLIHDYKRVFPNLLLTNFFVFFYYKDTGLIKIPRPFTGDFIGDLKKNFEVISTRVIEILENFITYSYKVSHSQDLSIIGLQKKLALKTFYLRQKVLLPILENIFQTGPGNEMIGIYNIYCDFFNERLTTAEFSAFLSHLITDVFLRACIFYKSIQPDNDTGISPPKLYRYTQFTMMPERRKTLFKYLSSVGSRVPTAVKWVLDDI